jgi:DNA gyrase/topoisomerase IV subunit A
LVSRKGMVVRIPAIDIRKQGRNTMGVRLMRLNEGDRVINAMKV